MNAHIVSNRFVKCLQYLKDNEIVNSYRSFALKIEAHPQSINDILKGKRNVTIDILTQCMEHFQFNPVYLFSGQGSMFIGQDVVEDNPIENQSCMPANIGYVPVAAQAGYGGQVHSPVMEEEMPLYSLPGYEYKNGVHRCFDISGDSMEPALYSGDKVVCSLIDNANWDSKIKDGLVYIVITEDSVYVKRVTNLLRAKGKIILASDNSYYADFELKEEEVHEVWHVETTISPFNGSPKSLKNGIYDQVDSLRVVIEDQTTTIKNLNSTIELLLKSSRSSR